MYGISPKDSFIQQTLRMLPEQPKDGMVVFFHREGFLRFDGLTCHRTASFPTGVVRVANDDKTLDCSATFVAGFVMQQAAARKTIEIEWPKICRASSLRKEGYPHYLFCSSPEIMVTFTRHATALPELTARVPTVTTEHGVKNRQALLQRPASIVMPEKVRHVQGSVRWALDHGSSLTVVGGGHSGHCWMSNVVSIDLNAFDQIYIVKAKGKGDRFRPDSDNTRVVVEAGCKSGDVIRETMAAGLTIPMGARPSVGAGLWLQGGIGHLARLHGLACDSITGAVIVSVASGQIFCIGDVPGQFQPVGAMQPENGHDLLWAMRGARTNLGIVISVTFKAYVAPSFSVRNWVVQLSNSDEA